MNRGHEGWGGPRHRPEVKKAEEKKIFQTHFNPNVCSEGGGHIDEGGHCSIPHHEHRELK